MKKCSKCEGEIGSISGYTETRSYKPDGLAGHSLIGGDTTYQHSDKCPLILKEEHLSASLADRALTMTEKANMLWSIAIYFEKNQDKIDHITGRYAVNAPYPSCPGSHLNFLFSQDKFVSGEVSACGFFDGWKKLSCALGLAKGDLFIILHQLGAANDVAGDLAWKTPVHKVFFKMRLIYSAMSYGL